MITPSVPALIMFGLEASSPRLFLWFFQERSALITRSGVLVHGELIMEGVRKFKHHFKYDKKFIFEIQNIFLFQLITKEFSFRDPKVQYNGPPTSEFSGSYA